MNKKLLIVIFLGLILVAILAYIQYVRQFSGSIEDGSMVPTENKLNSLQENSTAQLIAGSTTPYHTFSKAGYDKAIRENKVIILNFYANWCPICRAEAPEIEGAFNALTNPNVVGFRVNFNDPETDDDEKALAQEFKVPYQHTKIIVKNGAEVKRISEQITKDELLNAIQEVL